MRSRIRHLALVAALTASVTSCVSITTPLDVDLNQTQLAGLKTGKSDWKSIAWLFAWGDGGTQAAAEDGGISVVHHADQETYMILYGLFLRRTTVVYGE